MASATRRSSAVVTLRFSSRRLDHAHQAAGRLHQRGVVGGGRQRGVVHVERRAQHVGAEDLGRLDRPQRRAIQRAHHAPLAVGLLHRVGERGRGDRAVRVRQRVDAALDQLGRDERPGGVVDDRGARLRRGGQGVAHRLRARPAADHAVGRPLLAGRHGHDHAIADAGEHLDAPLEHRASRQNDERLGPVGPKAFAAAAGSDDADDSRPMACVRRCHRA